MFRLTFFLLALYPFAVVLASDTEPITIPASLSGIPDGTKFVFGDGQPDRVIRSDTVFVGWKTTVLCKGAKDYLSESELLSLGNLTAHLDFRDKAIREEEFAAHHLKIENTKEISIAVIPRQEDVATEGSSEGKKITVAIYLRNRGTDCIMFRENWKLENGNWILEKTYRFMAVFKGQG